MTTYTEYLTALGALTITGVTRTFTLGETPPGSLNAADLPAMWMQVPEGDHNPMDFGPGHIWPSYTADLLIAVLPYEHSTAGEVFQSVITIMDAIATALNAAAGQALAWSSTSYTVRQALITVNQIDYWGVVATVKATG